MLVVNHDEFVKNIRSDPRSIYDDKADVGVCIAGSGVPECTLLNTEKGIRAAVIHNKYLA